MLKTCLVFLCLASGCLTAGDPTIIVQPGDATIASGQVNTFEVQATGAAPLAYQWQRQLAGATTWNNIRSGVKPRYTVPLAMPADSGTRYRCLVTSGAGSATSADAGLLVTGGGGKSPGLRMQAWQMPGNPANPITDWVPFKSCPDLTDRTPDFLATSPGLNYAVSNSAWPGFPTDMVYNFAVRWHGYLKVDTAGAYTLSLRCRGGGILYLDGAMVVDNDVLHGNVEKSSTALTLSAGYHAFRVEYFCGVDINCNVLVSWSGPGITKQEVPSTAYWQEDDSLVPPTLNVITITSQPRRASIDPGQSVPFSVAATSVASPLTYIWDVSPDHGQTWSAIPGATTTTFTTPVLNLADDGVCYRCRIASPGGRMTSRMASVVVRQSVAPRLDTILAQVRAQVDRSVVWAQARYPSNWAAQQLSSTSNNRFDGSFGTWGVSHVNAWEAGLWPGILWQMHQGSFAASSTGAWMDLAKAWSEPMRSRAESPTAGPKFERTWNNLLVFGPWYQASTGLERQTQLNTILKGADIMVAPWLLVDGQPTPVGQWHNDFKCFGYPLSPDPTIPGDPLNIDEKTITYWHLFADHVPNLEQLAYAAQWTSDSVKAAEYRSKLLLHAQKIWDTQGPNRHPGTDGSWQRGYLNIGRTDTPHVGGKTYRLNDPNHAAGAFAFCQVKQGYSDGSTWSRGHGWIMHGVGVCARETNEPTVIALAKRTADYVVAHMPPTIDYPSDPMLPWDYDSATVDPGTIVDSSAATITVAGMLALVEGLPVSDPDRLKYLQVCERLLQSLTSAVYLVNRGDPEYAVFRHGAYFGPNTPAANDNGTIYGDYYGIEALLSYRRLLSLPSITTNPVDQIVTVGQTATFTAGASGNPAPTFQWRSAPETGPFTDISGATSASYTTPATTLAQNGTRFQVIATNSWGTATSIEATLTVIGIAPAITSSAPTTATVGTVYTYTIAATGTPAPTLSVSGNPSWLSLSGNTLSGTPAMAGTVGPITLTASNGENPNAIQTFNIAVNPAPVAPAITSTAPTTATVGTVYTHTIAATGNPVPALSVSGNPAWLILSGNTLSGTPTAAGATGAITVTAHNGVSPNASQTFSITVNPAPVAPAITSTAPTTATVGTVYTYTIAATGTPVPTLSVSGNPAWLNLAGNVLSGTPTTAGATAAITVTANNGVNPDTTQTFSIIVNPEPNGGDGGGAGGGSGGGCGLGGSLALIGLGAFLLGRRSPTSISRR